VLVTFFPDVEYRPWRLRDSGSALACARSLAEETAHQLQIDTRATLLDTLREQLQLFGTKERLRTRTVRRPHGAGKWTSR